MEELKNLYAKNIEREIQGVITVDSEEYISQELEEYVVTEELLKHFHSFFAAYNKSIDKNTYDMGVWISGFFGSGKSHFLKILSYLLENKHVNNKPAVDYFDDKIKDDPMLLADIKRAGNISSDILLFNIDSKTENSNGKKDSILEVFEKVFNEQMGLSITPFVAEIERYIISQGKYDEFKQVFKTISNTNWEDERDSIQFIEDEFATTYSQVLGKSEEEARKIVERTENNYTLSIEDFAKRVKDYIKQKENKHHVVFLVDEIGQYIGDDRSAMLNLQTMVEDLGTYCEGKAWVIVTSQEAIDDIVKVKGNDFSKIQGRFATKLSLSSSDIDEVIRKRILEKTPEAEESLKMTYDSKGSIIRNLFTFTDAAYQKIYKNDKDFAQVYPFVPYQFKLLQDVFTNIRRHRYAGAHLSSGERSLLGAFQETAKLYGNNQMGAIIPLYAFYETIEGFLEHQIKIVIKQAKNAIEGGKLEPIDLKVLKMLFMLKNIKEMPSNIDNLTTLYISNIQDDKITIRNKITDSLRRLEKETLIQRNGEEYRFLTHEEQEIDKEIKYIHIEEGEVLEYLYKIIFGAILPDSRFMYKKKEFKLMKFIDDQNYTSIYDIGIKIITNLQPKDDVQIKMQSATENNYAFIKIEIPALVHEEIEYYLKLEKYQLSKTNIHKTQQEEDIITAKRRECEKQKSVHIEIIKEQLKEADIFVWGDRQVINAREAKARVKEALEIVVKNIYNKFDYIVHNFTQKDIENLFAENRQMLIASEVEFVNQKAYDEIKEYFEIKNLNSQQVTIKSLLDHFEDRPYGFLDNDILYILTRLLKDEVVSLVYNAEVQSITSENTLTKIINKYYYDRTVIKIRKKVEQGLISDLKSVASKVFNVKVLRDNEDGMVEDFKNACLSKTLKQLNNIASYYKSDGSTYQYPGQADVNEAIHFMGSILRLNDVGEIFKEVSENKGKFSIMEEKIDDISNFFEGNQKTNFDKAVETLTMYDNNKTFIDETEELKKCVQGMIDIIKSDEIYEKIPQITFLERDLKDMLAKVYKEKSQPVVVAIDDTIDYIKNELKALEVEQEFGDRYINNCNGMKETLSNSNELKEIYAIQAMCNELKDTFDRELKQEISKRNVVTTSYEKQETAKRLVISKDNLMKGSYEINSKEDVENYIQELRTKLLAELEKNNKIIIR